MRQESIAKLVKTLNELLDTEKASLEEVEALIHSLTRHFLDNLTDIADIDYFQDRLNDMMDSYVDTHFEENLEENVS
ncbi:MAG TPA: hypothetical protein QF720_00570 [Nitrospinota bacterium]|jgi:hypothetical protein|nr:hypothetical protein [Nitrospinota bacterium]|tara:strand:+ start:24413 stop:24643 length:231 start_codon:yes stop_codon:yes gene_type:complete